MIESGEKLARGTKVRVVNFPPNADPRNRFNWNGKVGAIKNATAIGSDVNGFAVYEYEVEFKDVEVPEVKLDPKTNTLLRTTRTADAQNWFAVSFLELA